MSLNCDMVMSISEILNYTNFIYSPSRILTSSEVRVLLAIDSNLDDEGKMRLSDLGRLLHLAPSALSQIMRSLECYDLIKRDAAPDDRRAVIIQLTEEGHTHVQGIWSFLSHQIEPLISYLGVERAQAFSETLSDILSYLKTSNNMF